MGRAAGVLQHRRAFGARAKRSLKPSWRPRGKRASRTLKQQLRTRTGVGTTRTVRTMSQ